MRGYGIGADGIVDTADDERTGVSTGTCADLNTIQWWGSTDWIKIPLIENKEPWEMIENGGECCGRNITSPTTTTTTTTQGGGATTTTTTTTTTQGGTTTTQGGTTTTKTNCSCTTNGCSADCDKNTSGDNWVCKSPDEGTDSDTCKPSSTTVTCGKCGDSNETCKVGTPEKHPPNTPTEFIWNCRNIPHTKGQCAVKKILCRAPRPTTTTTTTTTTQAPVDATCNNSTCGGCSTGHHGGAITCIGSLCGDPDAFKTYEWKCDGLSGGADDTCTGNFRNCN